MPSHYELTCLINAVLPLDASPRAPRAERVYEMLSSSDRSCPMHKCLLGYKCWSQHLEQNILPTVLIRSKYNNTFPLISHKSLSSFKYLFVYLSNAEWASIDIYSAMSPYILCIPSNWTSTIPTKTTPSVHVDTGMLLNAAASVSVPGSWPVAYLVYVL
jgi:hypothetical protein